MTALRFIMAIANICNGDKHPNLRHRYTLQDMIDAGVFAEYGDNVANVTFYDLETDKKLEFLKTSKLDYRK